MNPILCLETATKNCSVAIHANGKLLHAETIFEDKFVHAEKLHELAGICMEKAGLKWPELAAVCVSKGPGSYTGLRIGVSAAKGYAYALQIPLLAISSLDVIVLGFRQQHNIAPEEHIIPLIDARRMEIYTQTFAANGKQLDQISAHIVEENSFQSLREQAKIHLCGDAVEKCKAVLGEQNITYTALFPSASYMGEKAQELFDAKQFEDTAYFEPFYLKGFGN